MYSDRVEALVVLHQLTQSLSVVVDAILAMEPSPPEQYNLMSKVGQRLTLTMGVPE
jgi:hypothetical protein